MSKYKGEDRRKNEDVGYGKIDKSWCYSFSWYVGMEWPTDIVYRRKGDKMSPEVMTKCIIALEKDIDMLKTESPKSLRRRVLEWLID